LAGLGVSQLVRSLGLVGQVWRDGMDAAFWGVTSGGSGMGYGALGPF